MKHKDDFNIKALAKVTGKMSTEGADTLATCVGVAIVILSIGVSIAMVVLAKGMW